MAAKKIGTPRGNQKMRDERPLNRFKKWQKIKQKTRRIENSGLERGQEREPGRHPVIPQGEIASAKAFRQTELYWI
jgi:hypothetical protein